MIVFDKKKISTENIDKVKCAFVLSPCRSIRKHSASLEISYGTLEIIIHNDFDFHFCMENDIFRGNLEIYKSLFHNRFS